MSQDEAGFGRINKPKYCWCNYKINPTVFFYRRKFLFNFAIQIV